MADLCFCLARVLHHAIRTDTASTPMLGTAVQNFEVSSSRHSRHSILVLPQSQGVHVLQVLHLYVSAHDARTWRSLVVMGAAQAGASAPVSTFHTCA